MSDEIKYGGLDPVVPDQKVWDKTGTGGRWTSTGSGNFQKYKLRPHAPTDAYLFLYTAGTNAFVNNKPNAIDEKVLRLWVHEFNLAYSMHYTESQTAFGKSFYPRHAQYPNVSIKAQTASQQHYDDIVEKLIWFQSNAIMPGTTTSPTEMEIVRFYMPEAKFANGIGERENGFPNDPKDSETFYKYSSVSFDGYPVSFKAGHTKANYNPEIEILFMIVPSLERQSVSSGGLKNYVQEFKTSLGKGFNLTGGSVSRGNPAAESGYTEAVDAIPGGPGGNQG